MRFSRYLGLIVLPVFFLHSDAQAAIITAGTVGTLSGSSAPCLDVVQSSSVGSPVSISTPCGGTAVFSHTSIVGSAAANSVYDPIDGLLMGAYATMDFTSTNTGTFPSAGATIQGIAGFEDLVTMTGGITGTVGYLLLEFAVDGTSVGDFTSATLTAQGPTGLVFVSITGSGTVTLEVPFVFDDPAVLRTRLIAGIAITDVSTPGIYPTQTVDFLNTAHLTSITVLDGNRALVVNGGVVSSSGLTYPTQLQTPEPASVLLLGTGLLGVGVRRWRRVGRLR
jgi:PEP-CTERM motif-containing protein